MHTSPCLETLLVSPVEEKPEEKGSIEDWVEGAPFTETNSTSPKSWPYQDAHLSLETPLPCRLKLQRESAGGWACHQCPKKELQGRAHQAL